MTTTPLYYETNFADTEAALVKLIMLLSPAGMATFLNLSIGPFLRERAKARFENEGDDAVGMWAPLQPGTVAIRQAANLPGEHPINKRTGELENWVVGGGWAAYPVGYGGSLQYPANSPSGRVADKAKTAQQGSANPLTVPRPVLAVSETDLIFTMTALMFAVEEAFQ